MTHYNPLSSQWYEDGCHGTQIMRHRQICKKLNVSSAKLFDMVAKGQFPKPFVIIPGGRAKGWLEGIVDAWIMQRAKEGAQ